MFAVASIAIHYRVKFVMHHPRAGSLAEMGSLRVGQPAPDFTLPDLAGHSITLNAYRGQKIVLMDFWASWCVPCRMAMPDLQELADKFKDRGLQILGVDQGESADQVRNFLERRKYSFQMVLDRDQAVGSRYGVSAIPVLVLVDKQGAVRWISGGYSGHEDDLQQLIAKLAK